MVLLVRDPDILDHSLHSERFPWWKVPPIDLGNDVHDVDGRSHLVVQDKFYPRKSVLSLHVHD